jgi:Pyrimidine reductase, riboflavin biosynthesis
MKTKVICYMMSSVDGRLHPERYTELYDGTNKQETAMLYFEEGNKMNADGLLVGRTTFHGHFMPDTYKGQGTTPIKDFGSHKAVKKSGSTIIVSDRSGKILYERTEHTENDSYIAILGEGVSQEYLEHLRKNEVSYVFAGADGNDFAKALEVLHDDFGIKTVLLKGGAVLCGAFLKAGLIDELSLMVYPGVDGLSGVPSIFEYQGEKDELPAAGQALELLSAEKMPYGIVWLKYRFHKI